MEKRISKVPENESKNERFKRVVVDRVNKAVKAIDRVGNCAGRGYDYTPEEAEALITALESAVANVKAKYNKIKDVKDLFTL